MLRHGEARVLLTDTEFSPAIEPGAGPARPRSRVVIDVAIRLAPAASASAGRTTRRSSRAAIPAFRWRHPADEWEAIALNYTSGTTGNPKGVVCHHRGAYLAALSNIVDWEMPHHAVYLWTLPMFHCNGWCFPWAIAALAGTNVCLRKVEAGADLRRHPPPSRHALLRRADRAHHADQRPGRTEGGHRPPGLRARGGRGAAGGDDRGHGALGRRHHPRLRADRGLRPVGHLRAAPGMERARSRQSRRAQRPPGRALHAAGRRERHGPGQHDARALRTASPWARSCSAATSP